MKILHICAGLPINSQSGVPNYVRGIAESQCRIGYDVSVLSDKSNHSSSYLFRTVLYSSRIKSFYKGKLIDRKALKKLKGFLEKEKFDLIHIHLAMNLDWNFVKILFRQRYIVSLHDYWFLCPRLFMFHKEKPCLKYDDEKCKKCISYFERFKIFRGINKLFKTKSFVPFIPSNITKKRHSLYKELLENANFVLPVSNRVMEIFKNSGIDANYRVLHIGNITANNFDTIPPIAKRVSPIINLVFLGRLNKEKGAELLITISKKIDKNKIALHFYGDSAGYKDSLIKQGVVDHGKYSQKDLTVILRDMDAGLVLPIWEDNSPQVVIEMLNNHLPVFATKMGGIPDFVDENNGYLFNPFDENDFSRFISFINDLTFEQLFKMKKNIHRTKTPDEHVFALSEVYGLAIGEQNVKKI